MAIPHLVKVQQDYAAKGIIVVAAHCQDVPQDQVCALCREKGMNYTVVSGGRLAGDDSNTIPHAWLFDASGNVVKEFSGPPEGVEKLLDQLVQTEPHWICHGRKLAEPKVLAVADALKQGKTFGSALADLASLAKNDKTKEEADFLMQNILTEGQSELDGAQKTETVHASLAVQQYQAIEQAFKTSDVSKAADKRLKDLKKDKAFQHEAKADGIVIQIEALLGQLIAVNGKYDINSPRNQNVVAQIVEGARALKSDKDLASTNAAQHCFDELKGYGFQ